MKKLFPVLLALAILLNLCSAALADETGDVPVFEDGMAQPILKYTNLRDEDYTNEGSDILRFTVYVETDHDTDGDGNADLVEALIQVPRAAAEGKYKAAAIYDPTPYGAGTVDENPMDSSRLFNPAPFDYDKLYEPGEKRTPAGSMTTLEAAQIADPETWNYKVPYSGTPGYAYARVYDYYLVRGFAVVEAGGIGTYGSEGFELCGFDLERDAHKNVVEWLTGDRVAYTDPYNNIEIKADWCNGNVAMTGCSYGGTLPYEVATTGVKGLKTIIPFAGIASWYDYTNSQGAPLYLDAAYGNNLASYNSGAAYLDDDWTVINDDYASFLWQFSEDQKATNGNYDEIWSKLDYSLDASKINCSALIVHGMNDFNVTTKQSDLMARAFARAGQPFKLVLHQDGHNFLNGAIVNGDLWQHIMNKWLSHYLYDVDNGIENMPTVSVQSNVDGSFRTYETWGDFDYDTFAYDKAVNPDDVSHVDTTAIGVYYSKYENATDDFGNPMIRDDYYLTLPDSAAAFYVFDVPDNYTFYGVPEVHLKLSTKNVDKDTMVISALLIDTIDGETDFKAYLTKQRLNYLVPKHTLGVMETGGGLKRTKVFEFVKSNTDAKLITFGHGDLANYGGGYEGRDYTKLEEPMKAGEYYDYTLYLQPTSYTFEPGHKAVLVITGWDPYRAFRDVDYYTGAVSDSTESGDIYAFNIDNSAFEFRFPQEKGHSAAKSETLFPFRFASKEEGTELMLANEEYYSKFSPNKLGYVMQNNDATMEEYLAFAKEQVLDWTDEEKDIITRGMNIIEQRFTDNGWKLPPLDTITFIKTTMLEENGVGGYTHGTQIYLFDFMSMYQPEDFADKIPDELVTLLAHELFHCLTRCNPDFRAGMYRIIGFTVEEKDFEIPPSVWEYYIVNPDVEHHNSWATFLIDGKEIDCFAAFVTTKHFEQPGEKFFQFGTTALVPVDGTDVYYPKDEVSNFDEVFGTNTGYVIDPEECMADNFKFAVLYGMDGPEGEGYPNPEIIEGVLEILSK